MIRRGLIEAPVLPVAPVGRRPRSGFPRLVVRRWLRGGGLLAAVLLLVAGVAACGGPSSSGSSAPASGTSGSVAAPSSASAGAQQPASAGAAGSASSGAAPAGSAPVTQQDADSISSAVNGATSLLDGIDQDLASDDAAVPAG
jgi:hypothetical protein